MSKKSDNLLRLALIISGLLVVIVGGVYGALNFFTPAPPPEVPLPVLMTPTPAQAKLTPTATLIALATPRPTSAPTDTTTPTPLASPTSNLPEGSIVYALSPDVNSVGWVQAGEAGNHFGESFLYAGLRDGTLYHGAIQFDLSFIPTGSTIFLAELELTGLSAAGLSPDNTFEVNILTQDSDDDWSRHNFEAIHNAAIDETLSPPLTAADLGEEKVNKLAFNAAQRSIIEAHLKNNRISFRLDSLTPEQAGWFGWDSGYGEQSKGHGPILRLGILPPVATAEATDELAEIGTPTPTPTFVLVTTVPTPENILTAAAIAPKLTLEATTTGTPTPLPANWVTPWVVTETPTPLNTATVQYEQTLVAAAVIAYGTPTPGPPMQIATPTPTATATPILTLLEGELLPIPTMPPFTRTMELMPAELMGKIAFKSDRPGGDANTIYVINPDGSDLAALNGCWPYYLAEAADTYSADGRFRVFTKDTVRYQHTEAKDGGNAQDTAQNYPAIFWYDALYQQEQQLSKFGAGIAYGGVWSPSTGQIALVATESQNDEIWVINNDGSGAKQLTRDDYAWWDKHPSWSPDGKQIVFWSNRTGHGQIFVMDADGGNLYSLSRTGFNDYDPVWIKYPGIPNFDPDSEAGQLPYIGSFGACPVNGGDLNCAAFSTQAEAQASYTASGGPLLDPYGLDLNHDGKACESLP